MRLENKHLLETEHLSETEYLSEVELEALISEVEENDMVMAPPQLLDELLVRLEAAEKEENSKAKSGEKKNASKKEFTRYCFRVITSAAAAIVLLFFLPKVTNALPETVYLPKDEIPTKQEVLATKTYATREEVLDDTSFLEKLLGNIKIQISKKENGGLIQ